MPAAAVIPAPIAYIKVAAVKKLVVGFWNLNGWSGTPCTDHSVLLSGDSSFLLTEGLGGSRTFTLNKLECPTQAYALNTLAWNNV